jgi:hypothetical protein
MDSEGNGTTSFDDSHQHNITNWVVEEVSDGHTHYIQRSMYGTSAFSFFLETLESTGYTLDINNPSTISGDLLISKASVQSTDVNYSEDSPSTIEVDLPFGIHRVELELNSSIDLSKFDFSDKSILDVFKEHLLVDLDLSFGPDIQGREAVSWIQPFSLTETDITLLDNLSEIKQIGKFGVNHSDSIFIRKLEPSVHYDVVVSTEAGSSIYQSSEQHIATSEIHKYSGDGSTDEVISMYHTPVGVDEDPAQVVWNQWPGDGTSSATPDQSYYTPTGDQITILATHLPDTTGQKGYSIANGTDVSEVSVVLDDYIVPGNPVDFYRDNILSESNFQTGDLWYRPSGIILSGNKTIAVDSRDFHTESMAGTEFTLTEINKIPLDALNTFVVGGGTVGGVYYTPQIQLKVITASVPSGASALEPLVVGGTTVDASASAITIENNAGADWHILIAGSTYLLAGDVIEFSTDYDWYSFEDRTTYVFDEWPIEETIAVTDSNSGNAYPFIYDEVTHSMTINGLPSLEEIYKFEVDYDYSGMQDADGAYRPDYFLPASSTEDSSYNNENKTSTHVQIIEATDNSIIYLNRIPNAISMTKGISVVNYSLFNYETEVGSVNLFPVLTNTTLGQDYIDVDNPSSGSFVYSPGDTLKVNYLIDTVVETINPSASGFTLSISNLPDSQFSWRRYVGTGITGSPSATSQLVTSHPVAPDATIGAGGINSGAIRVVATSSWTDATNAVQSYSEDDATVVSVNANIIIVDLSAFADLYTPQPPVTLTLTYPSYDHEELYNIRTLYDYYTAIDYSFKYSFETITPASMEDIYHTPNMLSNFYDISYYTATGDDLYMQATLHGSGDKSPIIRRLRFERE